jgi:hypothetical protein
VQLPVARAEDLIIYKAVAWRARDRRDIRELVALHRDEIDFERLRAVVEQFALAIEEPQRLDEFERLLTEATTR